MSAWKDLPEFHAKFCRFSDHLLVFAVFDLDLWNYVPVLTIKLELPSRVKILAEQRLAKRGLETVGDKLLFYRTQSGLTQKEVAVQLDMRPVIYSKYEEEKISRYPFEFLRKAAELFNVPIENLADEYHVFLLKGAANQIAAARTGMGMTREQFAKKVGTDNKTIKKWELGQAIITRKLWKRVKEYL